MNKRLHLSIVAFLIFTIVGITNAQNVKNVIVDIKIDSPYEGEIIPHRIPVEGIVEFCKINTNDFNNIISDFQGPFISNPIRVKREYVSL